MNICKETEKQHEAEVQSAATLKQLSSSLSSAEVLQNVSVELLSVEQLICSDNYEPV